MKANDFEKNVAAALKLDLPYFERPIGKRGTEAAVLVLFAWEARRPSILLTRRAQSVEKHKGEIAFPGGVLHSSSESAVDAALRETEEEIGLSRSSVRVVGQLPGLYTATGFWVTPVLGFVDAETDALRFELNPAEIAEVFWAPLDLLLHPETYHRETWRYGGLDYPIHVYQVHEHRVWGATAAMIKNLLDRLDALR